MSSGNTQSFLPQGFWQHGSSTTSEAIHLRKGTAGIRGGAADSRELAARSGGTNGWME